jgi:hypothetical protein
MTDKKTNSGAGFLLAIFVIFLVLKLAGLFGFGGVSWWIITIPLWISFAIALAVILFVLLLILIVGFFYAIWLGIKKVFRI